MFSPKERDFLLRIISRARDDVGEMLNDTEDNSIPEAMYRDQLEAIDELYYAMIDEPTYLEASHRELLTKLLTDIKPAPDHKAIVKSVLAKLEYI